jgi:hypothetical protein
MLRRLIVIILFIPVGLMSALIQLPAECIKWIITGEEIDDPWISSLTEWLLKP